MEPEKLSFKHAWQSKHDCSTLKHASYMLERAGFSLRVDSIRSFSTLSTLKYVENSIAYKLAAPNE